MFVLVTGIHIRFPCAHSSFVRTHGLKVDITYTTEHISLEEMQSQLARICLRVLNCRLAYMIHPIDSLYSETEIHSSLTLLSNRNKANFYVTTTELPET